MRAPFGLSEGNHPIATYSSLNWDRLNWDRSQEQSFIESRINHLNPVPSRSSLVTKFTLSTSGGRVGFSLVELLVVISIITLLMAILVPAINAARESGRQTVCMNNLRQFGVGLQSHATRNGNQMCSGAFDWLLDGPVTEVGWVADLVNEGTPTGNMLCPSNLARGSATLNDLLSEDVSGAGDCVDLVGKAAETAPDGTTIANPCRLIVDGGMSGEPRRKLIESEVIGKAYNTNFTASWFLTRSAVIIGDDGNLTTESDCTPKPALADRLVSRIYTRGPLVQTYSDGSPTPVSNIPILGDGATVENLTSNLGMLSANEPLVASMTRGPVRDPEMDHQLLTGPREGVNGWWAIWTKDTFQDYRLFAPIHRGMANILFADGSVRSYEDLNDDGVFNNGFAPSSTNGFKSSVIELPSQSVNSSSSLREF